jgi:hypothetical protein
MRSAIVISRFLRGTPPGKAQHLDGRSPGSRVVALRPAFPGVRPVAFWLKLSAYSCGGSRGIEPSGSHRIPFSSFPLPEKNRLDFSKPGRRFVSMRCQGGLLSGTIGV